MPNFLILKQTGKGDTDFEVVAQVEAKVVEKAIDKFGPQDEGHYVAVPFDREEIDKQRVQTQFVLEPITPEDEAAEELDLEQTPPNPGE